MTASQATTDLDKAEPRSKQMRARAQAVPNWGDWMKLDNTWNNTKASHLKCLICKCNLYSAIISAFPISHGTFIVAGWFINANKKGKKGRKGTHRKQYIFAGSMQLLALSSYSLQLLLCVVLCSQTLQQAPSSFTVAPSSMFYYWHTTNYWYCHLHIAKMILSKQHVGTLDRSK